MCPLADDKRIFEVDSIDARAIDPDTGISERDLNLLDAVFHHLAIDDSNDLRPNAPEEDEDVEWLMARARERFERAK